MFQEGQNITDKWNLKTSYLYFDANSSVLQIILKVFPL